MLNEIVAVLAQTMKQDPANFSGETVIKDSQTQIHWVIRFDGVPIGVINVVENDRVNSRCSLCEENMLCLRQAEELARGYRVLVSEITIWYIFSNKMNIHAANHEKY